MSFLRTKFIKWRKFVHHEKSEYPGGIGVIGLRLIIRVHLLILFSGAACLNLISWVGSRFIGLFGKLGRARRSSW